MTARFTLATLVSLLMVLAACGGGDAAQDATTTPGGPTTTSQTLPRTSTPEEPPTSPPSTEQMCTAIGCDSLLTVELTDVDIEADATYDVELCVDDDCRTETVTIDLSNPGTGGNDRGESERAPDTVDGWMVLWADSDTIDYYLPEGEYGESAQVSFTLTDSSGEVLADVKDTEVPLERSQPNGPDCPPVCFQGRLTI